MSLEQLKDPFPARDIEWRVQSSGETNGKVWARCLAYVTNRAIMNRLDAVVGPVHWRNEYAPAPCGGVMCGLSIRVGDEWVTKWDGAENTDIEGVKGGLSGAMKRAAVQWGIGRYLYDLEEGFARVTPDGEYSGKTKSGTFFKWNPPALPAWAVPTMEPVDRTPTNRAPADQSPAPSLRDRISALTAAFVGVTTTKEADRIIAHALRLAEDPNTPAERLEVAVSKLEEVRRDIGLPAIVATQPELLGV